MLPTKFRFIWPSGFRGEDLKKLTNQKQALPVVAKFVNRSGRNVQSLQKTFHKCFLPSFCSFGQAVSEEKTFQKATNQKQELPVAALFNRSGQNVQSFWRTFHRCCLLSFSSFGQAVQRRGFFKSTNQKQEFPVAAMFANGSGRNVQSLYRPLHKCFLSSFGSFGQAVQDQMCNLD